MRVTAVALLVALAAAAAHAAPIRPQRTVACSESIDTTRFPHLGNSQPLQRYRLLLGVVSVPPVYLQQVVATRERPWRYWRKAGLVVRAGSRGVMTITVPPAWRTRAAIVWGNRGGPFESLRMPAAPATRIPATPTRAASICAHRRRAYRSFSPSVRIAPLSSSGLASAAGNCG